eukprot:TRINITY_DN955_c0_g1_i8.p2 TRINITY_DN955_c0_g1~~TRINITY_DN955_c0_g1_i8.p2  ORF type:complete len:277 (-),score=57.14 TRINITY_DN955_c0_g1_i8:81-911(-)
MNIQKGLEAKGIDDLFKKVDTSGNGRLDANECAKFMKMIMPEISESDAQLIFQAFDQDKSGFVTSQEFLDFFCNTNFEGEKENGMLDQYRAGKLVKKLVDVILDDNINIDRLFKKFDISGDANLDLQEFTKILKLIDETLLDKEAVYIFNKFDADRSGTLSLKEFRKIVFEGVEQLGGDPESKKNYGDVQGNLSENVKNLIHELKKIITINSLDPLMIFKSFDKDSSGKLDFNEFVNLIRVVNARLSEQQIQEIFQAFDKNNDKQISVEEFKAQIA